MDAMYAKWHGSHCNVPHFAVLIVKNWNKLFIEAIGI